MSKFLVYIELIYQSSWQNQLTSKWCTYICIYLLLNTYTKIQTWNLYLSRVYTTSAPSKLHTQPEDRLHLFSSSSTQSSWDTPNYIFLQWSVWAPEGLELEWNHGELHSEVGCKREAGWWKRSALWEKVWRSCSAGLSSGILCDLNTTAWSYLASSSEFTTPQNN